MAQRTTVPFTAIPPRPSKSTAHTPAGVRTKLQWYFDTPDLSQPDLASRRGPHQGEDASDLPGRSAGDLDDHARQMASPRRVCRLGLDALGTTGAREVNIAAESEGKRPDTHDLIATEPAGESRPSLKHDPGPAP